MKSLLARMQSLEIITNLMFEKFRPPGIFFFYQMSTQPVSIRLLQGIIFNFLCAVDFIFRNLYILIEKFAGINESRLASFNIDLY